ncbi:pilus assembly protein PilM [Desulfococcaceae bacterium HSG8]|nr:pilus assembly protein PilM [Desulfococcaceae bacterium HSG8]
MSFQNSLGIDIKADKVAIAYLKTSLKGVKLGAHGIYSMEKETPLKEKLEIIRIQIADFMKEKRISPTNTFIGIPSELTIFKDIEFPLAVKENLRSTLRYEMEKHIPLPADDVLFDYHILSEDKAKNRLKVLLIVGKKNSIAPYVNFSGTLKGGVSGIEPCSTALVSFFAHKPGEHTPGSEQDILNLLRNEPDARRHASLSEMGIPSHELVPAFGLALKGLWKTPLQINLLPPESRKRPGKAGYYMMIFLAIMVILSGLAWGGSHFLKQKIILEELNAELKRLTSEIANIDRIRTGSQELEERLDYLNALRSGHIPALDILRELSQVIPETAWVREFRFSEKGMQIEGYAESASELIPLLEDSSVFRDVVFLSTITKEKNGRERFRVGLKLVK